MASSTRLGKSCCAGTWLSWKPAGMPSGATTLSPSTVMSTFRRSETSPSSSTRQRSARGAEKSE
eukprot:2565239-Pleurochrysis_carterae.AAC.1